MKIQDLETASITISVIKDSQKRIEKYTRLKEVKEIALIANDEIFKKIKDAEKRGNYSADNPAPMYYTGAVKDKMIDVLIQKEQEFLNLHIKKLEQY